MTCPGLNQNRLLAVWVLACFNEVLARFSEIIADPSVGREQEGECLGEEEGRCSFDGTSLHRVREAGMPLRVTRYTAKLPNQWPPS